MALKTERLTIDDKGGIRRDGCYLGEILSGYLTIEDPIIANSDEIGYSIRPKFTNRGYATEALIAVTADRISKNLVPILKINKDNLKSQSVAKKAKYFPFTEKRWSVKGLATNIKTKELEVLD